MATAHSPILRVDSLLRLSPLPRIVIPSFVAKRPDLSLASLRLFFDTRIDSAICRKGRFEPSSLRPCVAQASKTISNFLHHFLRCSGAFPERFLIRCYVLLTHSLLAFSSLIHLRSLFPGPTREAPTRLLNIHRSIPYLIIDANNR
jgi:hypothetical protein